MPDVVHKLYYSSHDSLVVDRKLLQELISSAMSAGWKFSDCKLAAKSDREVELKNLDHLSDVSVPFLETVESITMWFALDGGDRGYITLERFRWFMYGKPFKLSVTSTNEGAVLALKSQLVSLLEVRREWYSLLSRGLWYWIAGILMCNFSIILRLIGKLSSHSRTVPNWLDWSTYVAGLCAFFLAYTRIFIFPGVDFNLTEPPLEKTTSAKLREKLGQIFFGVIGGAILLGLVSAALKRLVG